MLDLDKIRIDGGTQIRVELNQETVDTYAAAFAAGAEFPPVKVFFDGKDRWLADGFHRYFGAKKAGKKTILESVSPGTRRDALLYSLGANASHGLNRTNADKRNAVTTMLQDGEWAKWSNREIAKACHVSDVFVGQVRTSLTANVSSDKPTERTFKSKSGTVSTMKTDGINKGRQPEARPAQPPQDDDEEDAVQILSEENDRLNDRLAVVAMDANPEERAAAETTIADLRALIKTMTVELSAVKSSRDSLMAENNELKKQLASQRKQLAKFKAPA